MVIAVTMAILLEFRIVNNFLQLNALVGHRAFIVNCLIGVAGSAFISLLISCTAYQSEKRIVINDYFNIMADIYLINDYYIRWIQQFYDDKNKSLTIPDNDCKEFENNLNDLCKILKQVVLVSSSFSSIIPYKMYPDFMKRYLEKKKTFLYCEHDFQLCCNEVYLQSKITYELLLRTCITSKEQATFRENYQNELRTLIDMLGSESKLETSRKQFNYHINMYLDLNEKASHE